jgi:multidrug efflux pump
VIVGGIIFSLILTLFVIPAMYSYLSSKKKKNPLELIDEEDRKSEREMAH